LHCVRRQRPYKLIDGSELSPDHGASLAAEFVAAHQINTLNVAGPRQSQESRAYEFTYALVSCLLAAGAAAA
jgi:hypothetical protein